jgi:hypothetical protein
MNFDVFNLFFKFFDFWCCYLESLQSNLLFVRSFGLDLEAEINYFFCDGWSKRKK